MVAALNEVFGALQRAGRYDGWRAHSTAVGREAADPLPDAGAPHAAGTARAGLPERAAAAHAVARTTAGLPALAADAGAPGRAPAANAGVPTAVADADASGARAVAGADASGARAVAGADASGAKAAAGTNGPDWMAAASASALSFTTDTGVDAPGPVAVAGAGAPCLAPTADAGTPGWRAAVTVGAPHAADGCVLCLPSAERPAPAARHAAAAEPVWRDTLTMPRHEPELVLRTVEAQRVASAVHALIATQRCAPGDIYVLSRKRASLRLAADALQALHVPYAAPEDAELALFPEVRDLVALLDVLASPGHDLALAQALKSPLFGADDADLIALASAARAAGGWWPALMAQRGRLSPALARARALLPPWAEAARRLPPHDLLDRIVHEGDLHARLAAVVPAERRTAALQAVDGLLEQALRLDGGRYATPYNFVRALRQRLVKHPPVAQPHAVQLLTIHGAKGLEAKVVFVMDAEPEATKPEQATLLVDWPVDAARPRRVAFVANESRCPPSLRSLLDAENAARRREELNGLYVAITRARERLVFSRTPPHVGAPEAWWQHIRPVADEWSPDDAGEAGHGVVAAATQQAAGEAAGARRALTPSAPDENAPPPPARIAVLPGFERPPPMQPAMTTAAVSAADTVSPRGRPDARRDAASPAVPRTSAANGRGAIRPERGPAAVPPAPPDDLASRLGQAVHRVLEWAADAHRATPRAALAQAAAAQFGLPAEWLSDVERLAGRVLDSPACAAFFDPDALRWAGNEVPLADGGDVLRIDRLVQLRDGVWWVLDYKLNQSAGEIPRYREQLQRYRRAVQALQPGEVVRAAFITAAGALIEPALDLAQQGAVQAGTPAAAPVANEDDAGFFAPGERQGRLF